MGEAVLEGGVVGGVPGSVSGGVAGGVWPVASLAGCRRRSQRRGPRGRRRAADPGAATARCAQAAGELEVAAGRRGRRPLPPAPGPRGRAARGKGGQVAPYNGRFGEVKAHLAAGRVREARALAESWNTESPGDVLALLALGEAWEAAGEPAAAARAYGSLIDSSPAAPTSGGWRGSASSTWARPASRWRSTPTARRSPSGRTIRPATASSPGPCSVPAASRKPSRRSRRGSSSSIREAASPGSTGSCAKTGPAGVGVAASRARPPRRDARPSPGARRRARRRPLPALRPHLGDRRQRRRPPRLRPQGQPRLLRGENLADRRRAVRRRHHRLRPRMLRGERSGRRAAGPYRLWVNYYSRGPMGYGMGTVRSSPTTATAGLPSTPAPSW